MRKVRVGVKGRKIFLDIEEVEGHHEGLVAVVAAAPIPGAQEFRKCNLGEFLSVAEDAKFRLAAQHLFPPQQRGLPAQATQPVIFEEHAPKILGFSCLRLWVGLIFHVVHCVVCGVLHDAKIRILSPFRNAVCQPRLRAA